MHKFINWLFGTSESPYSQGESFMLTAQEACEYRTLIRCNGRRQYFARPPVLRIGK